MQIRKQRQSKHKTAAYLTAALSLLLTLSACSPSTDQTPAPKLFKEQRDVLDKAKAVDAAQQKQNEEQQKALENQTQQ